MLKFRSSFFFLVCPRALDFYFCVCSFFKKKNAFGLFRVIERKDPGPFGINLGIIGSSIGAISNTE